jgi:hypothetical protein
VDRDGGRVVAGDDQRRGSRLQGQAVLNEIMRIPVIDFLAALMAGRL